MRKINALPTSLLSYMIYISRLWPDAEKNHFYLSDREKNCILCKISAGLGEMWFHESFGSTMHPVSFYLKKEILISLGREK